MAEWRTKVKIKYLYTEEDDFDHVQECMNAVAYVLEASGEFGRFPYLHMFRSIPQGDDVFGPNDYATRLLDHMYDYADDNRIWIE